MAGDMYLKLDDIPGESKDAKHPDEIDVLSWSWGMSNSGSMHMGGGGGEGKCAVQDVSVTKYIDLASAKLGLCCSKGTHIPEATLVVRKAGGDPMEYLIIKMKKILVSSVSTGGSGGEDRLTENVTLNFSWVELKYKSQKDDGTAGPGGGFSYDIETNTATAV